MWGCVNVGVGRRWMDGCMCVYRDVVSGGVMSRCGVMVCVMLVTPVIGHGMSCTLRNTKASFCSETWFTDCSQ